MEYTEKELQELHGYLLELLKVFKKICEAENIWYTLAYGTILGAVRHKGFIPWDPDVDVYLKLPDVERFRAAFNKYKPEGILIYDRNRDKKATKSHDTLYFSRDVGFTDVHLDIYPLVGVPDNHWEQKWFVKKCLILDAIFRSKYVNVSDCLPKNRFAVSCVKILDLFIPDSFIKSNIDKRERRYDFEASNYWFSLVGSYGAFPKKIWDERILMKFEDDEYYIPSGWDEYLKQCYGDYMTPKKY